MSFKIKITIAMTVMVAVIFSMGSTVLIHRSYMSSLTRAEQEAVSNINMLTDIIRISYESGNEQGDDMLLKTLRRLGDNQASSDAFLLYKDSELIYGSHQSGIPIIDEEELKESLAEDGDIYVKYVSGDNGMESIVSSSSMIVDETRYIICDCINIEYINESRTRMERTYRFTYLILLVITAILSWIISMILVNPMSKLTKATREIANGNLSYRSNITNSDEIGELSHSFDKMAAELEENMNLLEEAAEEKDRFMGAFTHELKTPMTSIIGYAELLRTQELEKSDRDDALQYIYSEAKRLENMSLKLLQIFVDDKGNLDKKKVSPADMVEDIVTHLIPTLDEQGIKIIYRTEPGIVELEPDLVRTLLLNIIDNARKAMDGKGRIRVDQKITDDGVSFIVADNGKGMPKEALEHITEAFYRVDKARSRAQGGAGLGLSLVKKIVELHDGEISFSSEPGVGTVVTVLLKGGKADDEEE